MTDLLLREARRRQSMERKALSNMDSTDSEYLEPADLHANFTDHEPEYAELDNKPTDHPGEKARIQRYINPGDLVELHKDTSQKSEGQVRNRIHLSSLKLNPLYKAALSHTDETAHHNDPEPEQDLPSNGRKSLELEETPTLPYSGALDSPGQQRLVASTNKADQVSILAGQRLLPVITGLSLAVSLLAVGLCAVLFTRTGGEWKTESVKHTQG